MRILLIIITVVLFGVNSNAQIDNKSYNFNKFQKKPYYFGVALGYNTAFFHVEHSRDFIQNPEFNVVESVDGPGFNIGVIGNLKIGQYFDLRSLLNFSFASRTLSYRRADDNIIEKERLESVFFEIPFLVRYKSAPYKDKRAFVTTGVKYAFDVANKKQKDNESGLRISPHDYQFEVGAGIQFFLPYFILSPEIKFSQGLGNILIYEGIDTKNNVLERVLSRSITISLNFEG
jgi:hypothetical protein